MATKQYLKNHLMSMIRAIFSIPKAEQNKSNNNNKRKNEFLSLFYQFIHSL